MGKKYEKTLFTPIDIECEGGILSGSVINVSSTIETTGQEVQTLDFEDDSFNHNWE